MYDTIYACQDREDDVTAGIKSTAVLFGNKVRMILSLFAVGFLVCLTITGVLNGQGPWYFVISVGGAVAHVTWQLYTLDFNDKQDCDRKFRVSSLIHQDYAQAGIDYTWTVERSSRIYRISGPTMRLAILTGSYTLRKVQQTLKRKCVGGDLLIISEDDANDLLMLHISYV